MKLSLNMLLIGFYFDCFDLQLNEDEIKEYALADIEGLKDFSLMPIPRDYLLSTYRNKLLHDKLNYNRTHMVEEHEILLPSLIDEQRNIYDTFIYAIKDNIGGVFFVYVLEVLGRYMFGKCSHLRYGEIALTSKKKNIIFVATIFQQN